MDVMPTIRVTNCFIFMSSSSVAPYFVAIARPRDFVVPRLGDALSLFRDENASGLPIAPVFRADEGSSKDRPNHSDH
jgi:hypothetical protein